MVSLGNLVAFTIFEFSQNIDLVLVSSSRIPMIPIRQLSVFATSLTQSSQYLGRPLSYSMVFICNQPRTLLQKIMLGVFSSQKVREKVVARFSFIWQLLSNHGVISLKIRLVIYNQTVQLVIFFNYI